MPHDRSNTGPGDVDERPGGFAVFGDSGRDPTEVGHYRILSVLGRGGMGVVYFAEQKGALGLRVALKLVRGGVDSREVLARFDAERQALGMMDHPNIAEVRAAGVAADGRPYFVMEHVDGTPITEHCDRHRLSVRERLELFIGVCRGVHHAHQKGVIHRDLSASNVLVAMEDGRAVPKSSSAAGYRNRASRSRRVSFRFSRASYSWSMSRPSLIERGWCQVSRGSADGS